jgi:hypothetical protein
MSHCPLQPVYNLLLIPTCMHAWDICILEVGNTTAFVLAAGEVELSQSKR